ncbi:hypothetical protein [Streptomyces sp. NPDC088258]|uniref:hypothetical protein n=1 Tax=Streptomyces sp. NPDC088258 TaxID=3365849 RepID=UPI0037FF1D12
MRVHTAAAAALVLAVTLTGCGSSDSSNDAQPPAATKSSEPAAKESPTEAAVDCADGDLSQAEWMEQCDGSGTGGDGGPSTGLAFGKSFSWPDGLGVTVVEAKVFSDWDEYESPDPKATEFRLKLKFTNGSKASVDLSELSILVDGATNGGQASGSTFSRGSAPLEGRIAPGVSAVKTDDNALGKEFGKKIVVTVQRTSDDGFEAFPEFEGSIG